MKTITKRRKGFLFALAIIAALTAVIAMVSINGNTHPAHADTYNSVDDYNFTLITDADGNSSYKVAIKSTLRNTATVAIVPDTYNGLPVTELANNAFMSCKKLTKVVLPKSVTTIGTNAFINCSQLKLVHMPNVQTIGATAFSMCTSLDRLYIPKTVKTVGANILKNNANTVFVQSAAEDLGEGWSPNWNTYHTGDVIYSSTPEDSIGYREIRNEDETEIIGYEITEGQSLDAIEDDVVIYNAYSPDGDPDNYKPVLNICQGAFSDVTLKSLTIKARPDGVEDFPVYDHAINIRSNAFFSSYIDSISIETDVTFNHPADLQVGPSQNIFDGDITGDANGHSVGVFEESEIKSVTLPSTLEAVYEKMFYDCTFLKEIKITGQEYDGINRLPNVASVGDKAFYSCGYLENIFIPSSVVEMGGSVFFDWGTSDSLDTHEKVKQVIDIDILETKLPEGWSEDWDNGIVKSNVTVNFKEILVTVDLRKQPEEFITLKVTPGEQMPEMEMPTYEGHDFRGIYSEPDGNGFQYYTSGGVSARVWQEGDPEMLYADWVGRIYTVGLEREGQNPYIVYPQFDMPMPAASIPTKTGYIFKGYYYPEADGTKTYYYKYDMSSAHNWDRAYNCTLRPDWELKVYTITYENLLDGINPDSNPTTYTIESETITFANPYGREGYIGHWDIPQIPSGSVGNKEIIAIWLKIEYTITYIIDDPYDNPNGHIRYYNIESETIYFEPPNGRNYYDGSWDIPCIPHGTTGNKTITAVWTPIQYTIMYVYGVNKSEVNNPNPLTITCEEKVALEPAYRSGYMLVGWQLNGKFVQTLSNIKGNIVLVAVWSDKKEINAERTWTHLIISVDSMTINMPSSNFVGELSIIVNSNVTALTLTTDDGSYYYNVNIDVRPRNSELILLLNNVKLVSRQAKPVISMPEYTVLTLVCVGECGIYGYDSRNGNYPKDGPLDGGVAIKCYSISILAEKLTIAGGNGGDGNPSGNGGYAIEASGMIIVHDDNVELIGGNGGYVKYGGTVVGKGSEATNKEVICNNGAKVTLIKGEDGGVW